MQLYEPFRRSVPGPVVRRRRFKYTLLCIRSSRAVLPEPWNKIHSRTMGRGPKLSMPSSPEGCDFMDWQAIAWEDRIPLKDHVLEQQPECEQRARISSVGVARLVAFLVTAHRAPPDCPNAFEFCQPLRDQARADGLRPASGVDRLPFRFVWTTGSYLQFGEAHLGFHFIKISAPELGQIDCPLQ